MRESLKLQGGGGSNGEGLRVWQARADLKCGFRATAMPTPALQQSRGSAQDYHTNSKARPSPSSSPPPGPIPTPQPASSRSPTSSQGKSFLKSSSLPISSPPPWPCLAALVGPSGPKLSTRETVTAMHLAGTAQGQGCYGTCSWSSVRQACAQEPLFTWNSDETEQGRENRDRVMVSQRDRKPGTKGQRWRWASKTWSHWAERQRWRKRGVE